METYVNFTGVFLRAVVEFWGAAMKPKLLEKETYIQVFHQKTLFLDFHLPVGVFTNFAECIVFQSAVFLRLDIFLALV